MATVTRGEGVITVRQIHTGGVLTIEVEMASPSGTKLSAQFTPEEWAAIFHIDAVRRLLAPTSSAGCATYTDGGAK
jgi:hypothetical protein